MLNPSIQERSAVCSFIVCLLELFGLSVGNIATLRCRSQASKIGRLVLRAAATIRYGNLSDVPGRVCETLKAHIIVQYETSEFYDQSARLRFRLLGCSIGNSTRRVALTHSPKARSNHSILLTVIPSPSARVVRVCGGGSTDGGGGRGWCEAVTAGREGAASSGGRLTGAVAVGPQLS
jgi:hypothetical protein